ncbi:ATP-binding protein [Krasilnikoviella flava]|uniref:Phage shock protein C (PspC) family protein n=1 Tax=Krasilnikoviella flava TaxID=526729 RepID=A0A1T5JET3_9MICO|nr:ATP-binding protein [Krasilnikoviella flava]SKC49854.1 phage shock protein C (PspC) family protein [Krasilnikoviella flava]
MTTERPLRLPLRRPPQGRMLGGVAAGLAAHLRLPVVVVRLAFLILTLAGGAGAVAYVFWWVTVPSGDPRQAADTTPTSLQRLAPRLRLRGPVAALPVRDVLVGAALIAGAFVLVAIRAGWDVGASWVLPTLVAVGGLALAWSQLDAAHRGRTADDGPGTRRSTLVLRLVGGVVLVMVGVLLLIGQDAPVPVLLQAAVASLAVLAGAALMLAPWWLRLVRELGDERAARAREAERADIAAHLHDSVLQTLALIRSRADDPEAVARMARAQERELREWLYTDRTAPGTSLAAELRALVAEVEDGRAVEVESVMVGDCVPTEETSALLQASREALVNAVVHGRPPVTVYLEVTDVAVEVFVRDRGDGFEMDDIAPDRFGVRESILGRVHRRGGTADVTSRPGWGTEVRLRMPRDGRADPVEPDPPVEPVETQVPTGPTSESDEGART